MSRRCWSFLALMAAQVFGWAHAAPAGLLDGGVTVTADPIIDARTRTTTLDITVTHGARAFQLKSRYQAPPQDAIAAQRIHTAWQDDYLFVRDHCGGSRIMRCEIDHIFTWTGAPKALVYVGDVYAGEECVTEPINGCALWPRRSDGDSRDLFADVYDRVEGIAPPHIQLRVEKKSGSAEFVADLDETWRSNSERMRAGEECFNAKAEERKAACIDGITPPSALTFNAVVAKYTKRDDLLAASRAKAGAVLCEGAAGCEKLRAFEGVLGRVKSGERALPRGSGAVVRRR
jgi:hypothetical protein